ncbi:phosphoglycerate mutase [Mycena amicta]|nr:phosphoglycerate mutase [Mycena amicta]
MTGRNTHSTGRNAFRQTICPIKDDNLRSNWAGWKDAPLSPNGVKQAAALGKAFNTSKTHFDYIYASNLLRADATGRAVLDAHSEPKPPFASSTKLREQHFGIAEGQPWVLSTPPGNHTLDDLFAQGIFPVLYARDAKFPEGESLDDLARRAEGAIAEFVVPHLPAASTGNVHIGIASHGLCISELVSALLRLDPESRRDISYAGLLNTAWTRAVVTVKCRKATACPRTEVCPPLTVKITDVNNADHLIALEVEDPAEDLDESKASVRAFFGGRSMV